MKTNSELCIIKNSMLVSGFWCTDTTALFIMYRTLFFYNRCPSQFFNFLFKWYLNLTVISWVWPLCRGSYDQQTTKDPHNNSLQLQWGFYGQIILLNTCIDQYFGWIDLHLLNEYQLILWATFNLCQTF